MGMPYGHMGEMDMGRHMGPMGRGGGRYLGFRVFSMLDLTKDQRKKINKLHDDMRKKHWEIRGEIMKLESELRDTYDAAEPDPKAVGDIYEKIDKLRRNIIVSRVGAMNKARKLLTPEQRKRLKSQKRSHGYEWGGGPMMRHRWRENFDD